MQPEPLSSFFSFPTAKCTYATAQPTAGAQPYQQAKEVPPLHTKAWQLTVAHRLDFSDNLLFALPTSPSNLTPEPTSQRSGLRWAQISPNTLKTCQTAVCLQAVLHIQLLMRVFISEVIRSIMAYKGCGTAPSNGGKWYKDSFKGTAEYCHFSNGSRRYWGCSEELFLYKLMLLCQTPC